MEPGREISATRDCELASKQRGTQNGAVTWLFWALFVAMPTLNVQTNVPLDGVVTSDILKDASKAVARVLGKPESVGRSLMLNFGY